MNGNIDIMGARLPIHFDVEGHSLIASDYLVAVSSLNECLKDINNILFQNQLEIEFFVSPDEVGTYKGVTNIVVKSIKHTGQVAVFAGGLAGLISLGETDSVRGFVKGLTKHEIDYYKTSEEFGGLLRDLIVAIYTTENDDIRQKAPTGLNIDKLLKDKTSFYSMCVHNKAIHGVGFDDSCEFPIKSNRFPFHTNKGDAKPAPSEYAFFKDTTIVSPVDVDRKIQWVLHHQATKNTIRAYMDDEPFKNAFLNGLYPLKQSNKDDTMSVLIEYKREEKDGEVKITETLINTVYSINDIEIVPSEGSLPEGTKVMKRADTPFDKLW